MIRQDLYEPTEPGPDKDGISSSLRPSPRTVVLDEIQGCLGYQFKDPDLLDKALTYHSAGGTSLSENSRLGFLGASFLQFVIAEYLVEKYPNEKEGQLTQRTSSLRSKTRLAKIARELGLPAATNFGRSLSADSASDSVVSDVFNAVLGAIVVDGGSDALAGLVRTWLERLEKESCISLNYPNEIRHFCRAHALPLPTIQSARSGGPDHSATFKAKVQFRGQVIGSSDGHSTLKEARFQASAEAWTWLQSNYNGETSG